MSRHDEDGDLAGMSPNDDLGDLHAGGELFKEGKLVGRLREYARGGKLEWGDENLAADTIIALRRENSKLRTSYREAVRQAEALGDDARG